MARKKKSSNKILYILVGVVVVLIIAGAIAKKQGIIGSDRSTKVELAAAEKTTVVEKVSASGAIQPEVEVKVSPEVSGEIIELLVEEGDSVQLDNLVIKIRPDNFQNILEQQLAALNQQKANLADSKARRARAEASFTRAQQDFDRQKRTVESESNF